MYIYIYIKKLPGFSLIFYVFTMNGVKSRDLLEVLRCEVEIVETLQGCKGYDFNEENAHAEK